MLFALESQGLTGLHVFHIIFHASLLTFFYPFRLRPVVVVCLFSQLVPDLVSAHRTDLTTELDQHTTPQDSRHTKPETLDTLARAAPAVHTSTAYTDSTPVHKMPLFRRHNE